MRTMSGRHTGPHQSPPDTNSSHDKHVCLFIDNDNDNDICTPTSCIELEHIHTDLYRLYCTVHNSHCCICSSGIFPSYSIYNRSLVGFCGCFSSYIVLANDYVKHLYFCYLPTPVITSIDHCYALNPGTGPDVRSTARR